MDSNLIFHILQRRIFVSSMCWACMIGKEQMVAIQKEIRERAIRGDFTDENLARMRGSLEQMDYPHRKGIDRSTVPAGWDRIHPGFENNENVNED
jgi:hypothetical protein